MDTTNPLAQAQSGYPGLSRVLQQRLLRRREELATAAVEHTGHDLPGADLLWQAVHTVEEQLRTLFPDTWTRLYPSWVEADAARLHCAGQSQPADCRLCATSEEVTATSQAS